MTHAWLSDDEDTPDGADGADGDAGAEGRRTGAPSGGGVGCAGVIVAVGVVVALAITVLALGLSSMCTDDFDSSDCGTAQAQSLVPLGVALVAAALWWLGRTSRSPAQRLWLAWTGAVLVLLPAALVGLLLVA